MKSFVLIALVLIAILARGDTPPPNVIAVKSANINQIGGASLSLGQKANSASIPVSLSTEQNTFLSDLVANTGKQEFGNDGRSRMGVESLLFFDQINGSTVNAELWKSTSSTMTLTPSNGAFTINSGGTLAANTYYNLQTAKAFNRVFEFPVYFATQIKWSMGDTETIEIGFMNAATNAAPTDGFFIRIGPSGIYGVATNAGVETTAAIAGPTAGTEFYTSVYIYDTSILYEFETASGAAYEVSIPILASNFTNQRLPLVYRVTNGAGVATTASTLTIYSSTVLQMDWSTHKPYIEQLSSSSHASSAIEPNTFIKTANWTNSTQPSLATLSNTAAGYSTLGGYFRFNSVAGANTDYALFGYSVPAGYTLVVKAIGIDSGVSSTMGTGSTLLSWGLGLGASAVSLATTDSWPTSSAPKYMPIGMQGFSSTANSGTIATPIFKTFNVPVIVEGGEFLHIILREINGPTSGTITGQVFIDGYFE